MGGEGGEGVKRLYSQVEPLLSSPSLSTNSISSDEREGGKKTFKDTSSCESLRQILTCDMRPWLSCIRIRTPLKKDFCLLTRTA